MPKSRSRQKTAKERARRAHVAKQQAERKKLTPEQYIRRRIFGWILVGLGVVVGVTHWLAHLGALYQDKPIWDLTIGYPAAAVLGVAGAIVLSK